MPARHEINHTVEHRRHKKSGAGAVDAPQAVACHYGSHSRYVVDALGQQINPWPALASDIYSIGSITARSSIATTPNRIIPSAGKNIDEYRT